MISLYTDCLALYFEKERDAIDPTENRSRLSPQRESQKQNSSCATTSTGRKFWNTRYRSWPAKARVHRLCTRAGMLESFLIAPEELTNDQVMELLKIAFRQPEVALALQR